MSSTSEEKAFLDHISRSPLTVFFLFKKKNEKKGEKKLLKEKNFKAKRNLKKKELRK